MMGRTLCIPPSNSCYFHSIPGQLCQRYVSVTLGRTFHSSWICAQAPMTQLQSFALPKFKGGFRPITMATFRSVMPKELHLGLSTRYQSMSIRLALPGRKNSSKTNLHKRHISWGVGGASLGLCLSFKSWGQVHAEASDRSNGNSEHGGSHSNTSHGKKIYIDYSITGIPGDGRCLFRSVAHGACIRSGKPLPDENLQRKLADELRTKVADEFIKRREETEWFVEGDFDTYVSQMRKPHVWGGEPELFIASHVLQMPITVYMLDKDAGGLISIAEYGQEYGKDDPIQVLYHGFGHYDALQIPSRKGPRSKL